MVRRSQLVVEGTVQYSFSRPGDFGIIETVTQVQVTDTIKGRFNRGMIEIVEPGGVYGRTATLVSASPAFREGQNVVLFLSQNRGHWEATDLALGAFYTTQLLNRSILVRSDEIEGWNPNGSEFRDQARGHAEFIDYVRRVGRGEKPLVNYMVDVSQSQLQSLQKSTSSIGPAASASAVFAASTYTSNLGNNGNNFPANGGVPACCPANMGTRWRQVVAGGDPAGTQAMPSGVSYFKNSAQNLIGAGDGGVSVIQAGMAGWNNDCGSATNLIYGGTVIGNATTSDEVNEIEFNDPGGRIVGSFTGSGVIALTFGFFNDIQYINNEFWWVFQDADIVFQDGITNAFSGLQSAMTHELGHSIGWRHSNATRTSGNDSAISCIAAEEECTTASNSAVMFFSVTGAGVGAVLQPWDQHAVRAVYPGGSCTAVRQDFNADGKSDIILRNTATGDIAEYQMNGTTITSGAIVGSLPAYTVATIGDFNGDGKADLALQNTTTNDIAIWLMNGNTLVSGILAGNPGAGWKAVGSADFNGDGKADIVLQNTGTGDVAVWLMNGGTITGGAVLGTPGTVYQVVGTGDFNGDGKADVVLQNTATGDMAVWLLNGLTITGGAVIGGSGSAWQVKAVGDANADGKADIFLRNSSTGNVAVWEMNGFTLLAGIVIGNPGAAYNVMGAADFNGDGKADLLLQNTTNGDVAEWLLNGGTVTGGAVVATPGSTWVAFAR